MSMPQFPKNEPPLNREDVINQIISSIAMEELGLSHIINAEGEKLQYALGTLEGATSPTEPLSIDDLMKLNESIHKTLDGSMQNQIFLRDKLKTALSASVMQGPTGPQGSTGPQGPTGPTGPTGEGLVILGYYKDDGERDAAHKTPAKGDVVVVAGKLQIFDGADWIDVDNLGGPTGSTGPLGPTGPIGPTGAGLEIKDYFDSLDELEKAHQFGSAGDVYVAGGYLYISDGTKWIKIENLGGPTGPTGPTGEGLVILGYYENDTDRDKAHPNPKKGDVVVVAGTLQIFDGTEWIDMENLGGPTGPTGPSGVGLDILGYYDSLEALEKDKGTGTAGDVYVAGGYLYISNGTKWIRVDNLGGPTGSTGPIGPTGPAALSYTVIPFCSQKAPLVHTNVRGESTNVALLGFGYMDIGISDPKVAIPIDPTDYSISLGASGNENRQVVFSLPFDMKLNSIYATVGNYGQFGGFPPSGMMVYPCIQLYYADQDSNTFNPIPNAYLKPALGIPAASAKPSTMRSASKTGLSFELSAGTRIAIGGLMLIEGDTGYSQRDYYLYFTGGIGLTPWIR